MQVSICISFGARRKTVCEVDGHGVYLREGFLEVFRDIGFKFGIHAEQTRQIRLQQILVFTAKACQVDFIQVIQIPVLGGVQAVKSQVDQQEEHVGSAQIERTRFVQSPFCRVFFVACPQHHSRNRVGQPVFGVLEINFFYFLAQCFAGDNGIVQPDDIAKRDTAQLVIVRKLCVVFIGALGQVFGCCG